MEIQNINNFSFKANIIDSHVHSNDIVSPWKGGMFPRSLDEFVKQPLNITIQGNEQTDNIKKVLVSSIEGLTWEESIYDKPIKDILPEKIEFLKDEKTANLSLIKKYENDDTYQVLLVCQPATGSPENIKKLINKYPEKIAGLKFHPKECHLNADSDLYDAYLDLAEKYKLPCLFHSEVTIDYVLNEEADELNYADPEYIYALARRHPNVPIILGHTGLGGELAHQKTIKILEKSIKNNDAKLYAEISWMDFYKGKIKEKPENILNLIHTLKENNATDRILFGTDAPLGIYGEFKHSKTTPKQAYENTVGTLKTAITNEFGEEEGYKISEKLFYENANKLFFNKPISKKKFDIKEHSPQILGGVGGIAGLGILIWGIKKLLKK